MTNDAPRMIWADQPQIFDDCDVWFSEPAEGRTKYIRADLAQAEKDAAAAAERKACAAEAAMVAESNVNRAYDLLDPSVPFAKAKTARIIAKAIRARGNTDALEAVKIKERTEVARKTADIICDEFGYTLDDLTPEGYLAILTLISDTDKGDQ